MKLKKSAVGNLHIVDGAGLEFNKKDRSMNRNAGLRTKSKSPDGVSRVKRRKPLAIKHIRRLRKVGIAAASVALCAVVGVGFGFFTSSPIQELPDVDYATVCYEVPENAGSPLSHSVIENVGYLNYVLKNQPYWSSEMQSNVSTIMSQTVKTYKKFYNGTLISADIAQGVSSTATQFCVADDVVLWRSSANKNFNGMDTEWSTKAPNGLTVPQYKKQRGLPPSEFSVYILNENTVKNANDFSVKDNGDGTFTMSLDLSVSTDDGLTSADYYYRQQMYVTGGLDERPTMNEASVTYTFDAEWRILSFSIYEDYTAKLAVPAPCTAETHTKFFYEEEKAKNTFYDDYFKHHIDSFTVADDVDNSAPSALNYLAAAFGSVLNDGATFKITAAVGNLDLDGVIHVGLNDGALEDIRVKIGDISVFMGADNVLYISDGNAKYKLDISAFSSSQASAEGDGGGLELNSILETLTEGEFTVTETGAKLDTQLELFGIKAKLHFTFDTTSGAVALGNVTAEVMLGSTPVNAALSFGTKDDIPSKPQDMSGYIDILKEGLTLKASLKLENFDLSGYIKILMSDGAFSGIYATLDDICVYFDYPHNMLYVTDGNVKYKVSVADLASGNIDLSGLDINGILGQIIQKLETSEDTISTGITLELFEQAITAALKVKLSGGINVGAEVELFGIKVTANVALTNEEVTLPDDLDSYADILNEGITLDVNLKVENLVLDGKVFIGLTDGKFTEIRADFKDIAIYYNNNVLYVTDGNVKYKVSVADLASGNIDLSGLDINGILGQIIQKLETSEDTISTGITLELFEQAITAALKVKLSGGINVGAEVELFGIKVTANVALTNEEVTLPDDLDSYADILNEGITLDVGLIIDEKGNLGDGALQLNGKVTLDLIGGKINQVKADFGEIAVYYNATQKTLFVKIADTKLKINLPETDTANIGDIGELLPDGMSNVLSELIKNLIVGAKEISTNANIPLGKEFLPVSATITLENGIGAVLETTLFGINATVMVGLSNEAVADVSDIDEYIDVVENIWGAVESIIGNSLSVNVSGNITNDGAVKYSFDALLEYDFNPVTYDADGNEIKKPAVNLNTGKVNENGVREGVSLSVDSEIYLHFNLALISAVEGADNLSLDLVVMDATPSNSTNGVTDGGYVKDGVLDIYLSVSKYASDSENYDPLMIYAPMDDILTLVSMVAAMANLDNISFEDNDELNSAVAEISGIIDSLLIDNYIPYTKDQFSSLGDSLIPQILGKSLKDYIGELLGSLKNTADDVVQNGDSQTESTISLNKDYVKSIACGNDSLKLTLDSSLIYGTDVEGDISVELIKGITADEKTRLTGVYLDNVYFGDKNTDKLALGVELSYGNIQRPDESAALGGYTNFNGVSDLLKAFVNSATHKTEEGETSYELNDYFLLQGKVNVNISVIGINIGVELNINSLSIKIDENNNVAVDAHLSYQGVQMLGQIAINGDSDVYLSIVNDMIYLKRIQKTYWEKSGLVTNKKTYATPVVEYRVMPLSAFSEDIMNEIVFIFNFGSLVSDQLTNIDSSSGTGANFENRDLGNLFKYVLAYYTTEQTSSYEKWNFAINGKLLSDLVGMTMSNIPITFIADKNEDGTLTVTGLDIAKSTMDLVSGIVSMNFDGNLRYCNPNGVIAEINGKPVYADSSLSLDSCKIPELGGRSFNSVLGGNNFADIVKKTDWAKLTSDLSLTYFKLDSSTPITVVDAKAEYTLNTDNTKFQTLVELDGILYNTATNTSYSTYVLPEVSELLPVEGEKYWDEVYDSTMKTLTYSAIYQPVFIDILSDINMTGASYDENLGKYVKSLKYGVGAKVELPLLVSAPSSYKFMGYYDNPEFTGMPLTEITVSGDAVYYAKWEGKNINLSYLSDVNANGEITTLQTESMVFGQQYSLAPMSVENHVFLGWFAQTDDGFVSITDGAALTEYSKWLFGESDSLDVNLYAVFVKNEIVIDITEVSGTQWKILGNYYIAYAEGISEQIANSAQVECSVAVTYYAHGKKLFGSSFSYDEIGKANFSGMSGSLNKTGMNCGNAVGGKNLRGSVKISASFSCGGIALGSTSEFEQFKDKS